MQDRSLYLFYYFGTTKWFDETGPWTNEIAITCESSATDQLLKWTSLILACLY